MFTPLREELRKPARQSAVIGHLQIGT